LNSLPFHNQTLIRLKTTNTNVIILMCIKKETRHCKNCGRPLFKSNNKTGYCSRAPCRYERQKEIRIIKKQALRASVTKCAAALRASS